MDFKKLDIWLQVRALVKSVYILTKPFPREEQFSLISQVKRCSVSVPSNIAKGCKRQSNKETIRFLCISRGSLFELETQLILANDLGCIDADINVIQKVERVKKLLNGFINYYKRL